MRDDKRDGKKGVGRKEGMKGYSLNVYDRRRGEKKIKEDVTSQNSVVSMCLKVH